MTNEAGALRTKGVADQVRGDDAKKPHLPSASRDATPPLGRTNRRMGGNHMIILPISLTIAAGAALLNLWIALLVGRVRTKEKVFIGDDGNDLLTRRMRAHSNCVENTPFMLNRHAPETG